MEATKLKQMKLAHNAQLKTNVEKDLAELFALAFGVTVDTNRETREQMAAECFALVNVLKAQLDMVLMGMDANSSKPEDDDEDDGSQPALLDIKVEWTRKGLGSKVFNATISSKWVLVIHTENTGSQSFDLGRKLVRKLFEFQQVSTDGIDFFQAVA